MRKLSVSSIAVIFLFVYPAVFHYFDLSGLYWTMYSQVYSCYVRTEQAKSAEQISQIQNISRYLRRLGVHKARPNFRQYGVAEVFPRIRSAYCAKRGGVLPAETKMDFMCYERGVWSVWKSFDVKCDS